MKYLYLIILLITLSCNNNQIGGVTIRTKNLSPIDTTKAVIVNKKYNSRGKFYSIVYKNIDNEFHTVDGKLTNNLYVNDSILVIYQRSGSQVNFINLIPYDKSKHNELILF